MTREEMIEQLENTILLIEQNGEDWWDDRDIPILKEAIKDMKAKPSEDIKDALHIAQTDRDKWKARAQKLAKIIGINDCDIDGYEQPHHEDRKNCPHRHENGNCLSVGGFCLAVDDQHCQINIEAHEDAINRIDERKESVLL